MEPIPIIMIAVAAVCAIAALDRDSRGRARLFSAGLAVVSGGIAWYMFRTLGYI